MINNLDIYLDKAKALHGDCCAGIVLGTRLTLAALKALGLDPEQRHKNLIVFVEIDRCMTDAIQAITGCTLGHRNLKYINYGKFGAIFYDLDSKQAVRVTEQRGPREHAGGDIATVFRNTPDEELIQIEDVDIKLDKKELPGKPEHIEACEQCGELVFDDRLVLADSKRVCLACADGAYYTPCQSEGKEQ